MEKMNQKLDMFSNPDMQMVMLKGVEKHTEAKAMVFWDKKTKEVYLNAEKLPKAPEGMQYQLWAIEDGKPVNAGMYTEDKDSRIVPWPIYQKPGLLRLLLKKKAEAKSLQWKIYVCNGWNLNFTHFIYIKTGSFDRILNVK